MNKPMLSILGAATLALGACGRDSLKLEPQQMDSPAPTVGGTAPTLEPALPAPSSPVVVVEPPAAPPVDTGTPVDDGPVEEPPPAEPPPPPPPSELRLVGLNTAGFTSVLLPVVDVRVTANGEEVEFEPTAWGHLELAGDGEGHVLGIFGVPEDVDSVQVELTLDQFGAFEDATGAGELDTRVQSLRFEVSTRALERGRPAVLSLDVGNSVVDHEGSRVFLPEWRVKF